MTLYRPLQEALAACLEASLLGDKRAFWLAHLRMEGEMMRLSQVTWALRPSANTTVVREKYYSTT